MSSTRNIYLPELTPEPVRLLRADASRRQHELEQREHMVETLKKEIDALNQDITAIRFAINEQMNLVALSNEATAMAHDHLPKNGTFYALQYDPATEGFLLVYGEPEAPQDDDNTILQSEPAP